MEGHHNNKMKEKAKICPVCRGAMGGKNARASSYGGVCCLSCRAFFRRAHQKSKEPVFECQNPSGRCDITPESRRRCPKCRLEACIKSGMRPDLVLTDQEKGKRFQKLMAKKSCFSEGSSSPGTSSSYNYYNGYQDINCPDFNTLQQTSDVQIKHESACEDYSQVIVKRVNLYLQGPSSGHDLSSVLARVIEDNMREFKERCDVIFHHKAKFICQEDRTLMTKRNSKLYINFLFGHFLTSPSLHEQISWFQTSRSNYSDLQLLGYSNLNEFLSDQFHLFNNDPMMQDVYLGFANALRKLLIFPTCKVNVMDLLSLHRGKLSLATHHDAVDRVFQEQVREVLISSAELNISAPDLYQACHTLEAMSQLFEHSGFFSSFPTLDYSYEEDLWFTHMKDKSFAEMAMVPVDNESVNEMYNFTVHGKPLSKWYGVRMKKVFMEQMWRMCLVHPEFRALPNLDQARTIVAAGVPVSLLMGLRLDNLSMHKQVEALFPNNANIKNVLKDKTNLRPVKARDVIPTFPADFEDRSAHLKDFVTGEDNILTFFSVMICATFDLILKGKDSCSDPRWKALEMLRRRCELNIARRFGSEHYDKIRRNVEVLKALGDLVPKPWA